MAVANIQSNTAAPNSTLDLVEDEAFIIVKAAPRRSETLGETVCCAGLTARNEWVRLYPVSFRQLQDAQRFRRWDHVRYRWSVPKATKDRRSESRRVDPNSVEIIKTLRPADRNSLVARSVVTSLARELDAGRSLAMLKPEIVDFWYEPLGSDEVASRDKVLENLRAQQDMFAPKNNVPMRTCPFVFKYRYRDDDGLHIGTCQDWETEQTFLRAPPRPSLREGCARLDGAEVRRRVPQAWHGVGDGNSQVSADPVAHQRSGSFE